MDAFVKEKQTKHAWDMEKKTKSCLGSSTRPVKWRTSLLAQSRQHSHNRTGVLFQEICYCWQAAWEHQWLLCLDPVIPSRRVFLFTHNIGAHHARCQRQRSCTGGRRPEPGLQLKPFDRKSQSQVPQSEKAREARDVPEKGVDNVQSFQEFYIGATQIDANTYIDLHDLDSARIANLVQRIQLETIAEEKMALRMGTTKMTMTMMRITTGSVGRKHARWHTSIRYSLRSCSK